MDFTKTQIFTSDIETLYLMVPKDCTDTFLTNGIKASSGASSIYLSRRPNVAYQCVNYSDSISTLKQNIQDYALLQVEINKNDVVQDDRDGVCIEVFENISADKISLADHSKLLKDSIENLQDLCHTCFHAINDICINIIAYYNEGDTSIELDVERMMWWLTLAEKLDFNCYPPVAWRNAITSRCGAFRSTFCDANCQYPGVPKPPLWANLLMYPVDKYYSIRTKLASFIINTWSQCLDTHTGGFGNACKFKVGYRK